MLTIRRGSASVVARYLSSLPQRSVHLSCVRPQTIEVRLIQNTPSILFKSFGTSRQWRQQAAAALEQDAIKGSSGQEANAPEPPQGPQINAGVKSGPPTHFKQLAECGMVCGTVIDTITRDMGLETMTPVQSLTIGETLKGVDVYVKFHMMDREKHQTNGAHIALPKQGQEPAKLLPSSSPFFRTSSITTQG